MLRFSYETLTNSWFYGEWIVKIIAKVMILIIHFVLRKKRRETMKDDKKEKSEQRYMERIRLIKDRVVNTRPEMDLENAKIMTESFKETAGEPLCIRKAKAFRRQGESGRKHYIYPVCLYRLPCYRSPRTSLYFG